MKPTPLTITVSLLASSASALQIGSLLSTCVDACQRGCVEIRAVEARRQQTGALKVELKDAGDARSALTEADEAAQRAIVGALRAEWGPALRIIGEEDCRDAASLVGGNVALFEPLRRNLFEDDIGETEELDLSEVTIFVDPLDGTREFVEGRLANCQSLVGVAVGGRAVAGAVGIPFPSGDLSAGATVVYGIADVGAGFVGAPLARGPYPLEQHTDAIKFPRPHLATGDSAAEVMDACRAATRQRFKGSTVQYGGAGNKILAAALGEVACSIQHAYGGPWDVCAPEAILVAMGGRLTDLFGDELAIYAPDAPAGCNRRGYVATPQRTARNPINHDDLTAALRAAPGVQKYREELQQLNG
jgi:3'-phosphoadenosine 5'-phosphosulfate (PAPS) 3'-phosphatase